MNQNSSPAVSPESILSSKLDTLHAILRQPEPDNDRAFLVGCIASVNRMLSMIGEVTA